MKVAILDLGTNVFNLLLSEISGKTYKILKVVKIPSFIGAGGFNEGRLSGEAMSKSIDALGKIREIIDEEGDVGFIKVFATSAFRDTVNGSEFANTIRDNFGFEVEIISGEREAELIYKGIRESFFVWDENVLMCDVGGGSNELIIADKEKILWKRSFNLGILRLKEKFEPSDPIKEEEVKMINLYLEQELEPLFEACRQYSPRLMIGSSGSFDTLRELLYTDDNGTLPVHELDIKRLRVLHHKLLVSNRGERLRMPGMSPVRVDYMVLGSIFIQLVIEKCRISKLYQSSYSLKEGFMAEMAAQL
ncbi:MAG TPA: hypothetical protein PLG03_00870 [Bacteroidales bacterium]|nr:hypothetical protein [Bacteroidales bacterium]HRR48811.1 hypothetical protein [Bacteroidales bacterium]HRT33103.1 hypothetical protein [Bacteroidales bacterium]HRT83125.1 hypothetical protein [Bacteroidales bacterium]